MTDNKDSSWFYKFSSFMDQNIRGVQYGVYSIAGLGLIFALRSVRPFAKFSYPSDIPSHFIEKKMPLLGVVWRIEPSSKEGENPILVVNHKPLVSFLQRNKTDGLPIEISGVNVTNNGFTWLHSTLSGELITFVPIKVSSDRVYCLVFREFRLKRQNVGEQLVKIGFGTVSPLDFDLEKNAYYLKYYKTLLSAEKLAEKKGLGIWSGNKVSRFKSFLSKLRLSS